MERYDAARYGRAVKGAYDELYPGVPDETAQAVNLLVSLAGDHDRSLLEFGPGTGRLALPVAAAGVAVSGIEGSAEMLAQLRAKSGGADIEVVLGDYRDTWCGPGGFAVVLLALNAVFDPRGRRAQLDIVGNAARHLRPGGCVVLETMVLDDRLRSGEWEVVPRHVAEEHVELQLLRYNLDSHQIERLLLHLRPSGPTFVSVRDTYASPSDLDLMAEISGLSRVQRFGAWHRAPFTPSSRSCISIYRLTSEPPSVP